MMPTIDGIEYFTSNEVAVLIQKAIAERRIVSTVEQLSALPPGSVVTTPFPDMEGNVAERASDGWWLLTGETGLCSSQELADMADTPYTVLRTGYSHTNEGAER